MQLKEPDRIFVLESHSPDETRQFGEMVGAHAGARLTLTLQGDLGSGKTVFTQGLARGLGVVEAEYVTSPTYTIINEYAGRCRLYHIDLYRISGVDDLEDIGFEDLVGADGILAVEWPERLPEGYFSEYVSVRFSTVSEKTRKIEIIVYGQAAADLIEALKNCL